MKVATSGHSQQHWEGNNFRLGSEVPAFDLCFPPARAETVCWSQPVFLRLLKAPLCTWCGQSSGPERHSTAFEFRSRDYVLAIRQSLLLFKRKIAISEAMFTSRHTNASLPYICISHRPSQPHYGVRGMSLFVSSALQPLLTFSNEEEKMPRWQELTQRPTQGSFRQVTLLGNDSLKTLTTATHKGQVTATF